ncbi:hypothetical protein BDR26DRAFT_854554 [Obelidium mucronatum]|nr:hypothetical protein BDR26DRAFT_854554 [Obelidium mucronatum]
MSLSQKLVTLVSPSSSITSPESFEGTATGSMIEDDEANTIRTKIAKVLHQIQIAVNNPAVNLFCFRPIAISFQLSVIEHSLFRQIHSNDVLVHKNPHPAQSLQAVSDFFNYFTRLQMDIPGRIKTIQKWFKVASYLKKFNNFQSLRGITSAMSTPPIIRLKKTWAQLKKKNSNELQEFEELAALVSEQNNYTLYRNFIKNNQTRPMVPFIGVILHDMTYLLAATKDPASDKRVLEIQKFIRYCTLGPRYSYEMLIDLDTEKSGTFSGAPGLQKKGIKRKVKGGGLSEHGLDVLGSVFKEANEEEIGAFISHWLLTRKWVSEKEVDEMSLFREPRVSPVKNPTISATDQSTSFATEEREIRYSKTDDETTTTKSVDTATVLLKPRETATLAPASPNLTRIKAMGGSSSFIEAIKETAYTLVSKQTKPAPTSGTSSPATSITGSGKQLSKVSAKLNAELPRGRQLDQLLRRRQKSLSNLDIDTLQSGSKSLSMDTGINSRNLSADRAKDAEKAGSFDSISGSVCQTNGTGGFGITDDVAATTSAYVEGFHGVESEELKRKLEILANATTTDIPEPQLRRRSSSSAVPMAIVKEVPPSHRHGFFSSFFSHIDDGTASSSDTSNTISRASELKPVAPATTGQKLSKPEAISSFAKSPTITEQPSTSTSSVDSKESAVPPKPGFFSFTKSPQHSQIESLAAFVDAKSPLVPATAVTMAHQPENSKEKAPKSRRRASSAGTVEAAAAVAAAKNGVDTTPSKETTTRDSVPEEQSLPTKEYDTRSEERNSVGTIKQRTASDLKAVKSKRPSVEPVVDKLPSESIAPVLATTATPSVLSWGTKFTKAGSRTPVSAPTPPAPIAVLEVHDASDRSPNLKSHSKFLGGKGSFSSPSPQPLDGGGGGRNSETEHMKSPALPALPKANSPVSKHQTPPVIPPKPAQLTKSKLGSSSISSLDSSSQFSDNAINLQTKT